MARGRLIVIEGTDGSGKATQAKLLLERLLHERHDVATVSFPQYGKKSAGPVEEYLNGRYGAAHEVSPHAASLLYAVDRFDAAQTFREHLAAGRTVVVDRYVASNIGHQGGKISDDEERKKFVLWLSHIEFEVFGIPRPDVTIFLHVPAEIGKQLVAKKQQRLYITSGSSHDLHEADSDHLAHAESAYLWLAQSDPDQYKTIECYTDRLLAPETIHERVWDIVSQTLA